MADGSPAVRPRIGIADPTDVVRRATRAAGRPLRDLAALHGNWRLGNMQCVGAEIRAVIDGEIWSVGDPRLDVAWMRHGIPLLPAATLTHLTR